MAKEKVCPSEKCEKLNPCCNQDACKSECCISLTTLGPHTGVLASRSLLYSQETLLPLSGPVYSSEWENAGDTVKRKPENPEQADSKCVLRKHIFNSLANSQQPQSGEQSRDHERMSRSVMETLTITYRPPVETFYKWDSAGQNSINTEIEYERESHQYHQLISWFSWDCSRAWLEWTNTNL